MPMDACSLSIKIWWLAVAKRSYVLDYIHGLLVGLTSLFKVLPYWQIKLWIANTAKIVEAKYILEFCMFSSLST